MLATFAGRRPARAGPHVRLPTLAGTRTPTSPTPRTSSDTRRHTHPRQPDLAYVFRHSPAHAPPPARSRVRLPTLAGTRTPTGPIPRTSSDTRRHTHPHQPDPADVFRHSPAHAPPPAHPAYVFRHSPAHAPPPDRDVFRHSPAHAPPPARSRGRLPTLAGTRPPPARPRGRLPTLAGTRTPTSPTPRTSSDTRRHTHRHQPIPRSSSDTRRHTIQPISWTSASARHRSPAARVRRASRGCPSGDSGRRRSR